MRWLGIIPVVGVCIALASSNTLAATAAEACEAGKLKAQGTYAACLLNADAQSVKSGKPADYAKCEQQFQRTFSRAEDRAGEGVCPTEGDLETVQAAVEAATDSLAQKVSPLPAHCPPEYTDRDATQLWFDLWFAVTTRNAELLACNYHDNAVIIADQGIAAGPNDIYLLYESFADLFNSITPTLIQADQYGNTFRILYSLDAGWVVIADGVTTFVVEDGRIRSETQHGIITFRGPPPDAP